MPATAITTLVHDTLNMLAHPSNQCTSPPDGPTSVQRAPSLTERTNLVRVRRRTRARYPAGQSRPASLSRSERVGIVLDRGGNGVLIEPGRVFPRHLSDHRLGRPADLFMDDALGVRPRGVAVRVVGLEQDVVCTDPFVLDE